MVQIYLNSTREPSCRLIVSHKISLGPGFFRVKWQGVNSRFALSERFRKICLSWICSIDTSHMNLSVLLFINFATFSVLSFLDEKISSMNKINHVYHKFRRLRGVSLNLEFRQFSASFSFHFPVLKISILHSNH